MGTMVGRAGGHTFTAKGNLTTCNATGCHTTAVTSASTTLWATPRAEIKTLLNNFTKLKPPTIIKFWSSFVIFILLIIHLLNCIYNYFLLRAKEESRPMVAGTFPPSARKSLSIPPHKQSSLLAIARNKKTAYTVFFIAGDGGIPPYGRWYFSAFGKEKSFDSSTQANQFACYRPQ